MQTAIATSATLAALVDDNPALARELERRSLDYCCGGQRTLADACADVDLDPNRVAAELAEVAQGEPADWIGLDPAPLVDHIESTHHAHLHDELPRLAGLVDKVASVHSDRHPELSEVQRTFIELRADLEPHLAKEERVLFPMIREMATHSTVPEFHCGSLSNPISVMLAEHDRAGDLLEQLRRVTSDYTAPPDACGSYRALYAGLEELEADTHLHVHKENNALFPAVVQLEQALAPDS